MAARRIVTTATTTATTTTSTITTTTTASSSTAGLLLWLCLATAAVTRGAVVAAAAPADDNSNNSSNSSIIPCGPLQCQNAVQCWNDKPDFESHRLPDGSLLEIHAQDHSIAEYHCSCHTGWTGVSCDVQFRSCDNSDHKCYHGGECVLGLIDMYDNEQMYCNCDNANEGGNRYVGKYCEIKAMELCDPSDETRFCLNGGICNQEYPAAGNSCICDMGFKGPHCEYKEEAVPDCVLDCRNGGHCVLGTPGLDDLDNFAGFWGIAEKANELKQYCQCQPGFHGQFCEVISEPCGDDNGRCFHGSKCTLNRINGKDVHHCDCRFSNQGDVSYAGRYCQYEANEYCDKGGSVNGNLFCVNGGKCQEDAYLGCVCPDGFRGFSCEYFVAEDLPPDQTNLVPSKPFDLVGETGCSLDCNGRGQCRDGIKHIDDQVMGEAEHLSGDEGISSENFEHCVCQHGWTGLQCEHEVKECDGGAYHCFHGSECNTGGVDQMCDCSTASSAELGTTTFGGDQCQHPATEICNKVVDEGTLPSQGLSFCVNQGTCKAKINDGEPHPGCHCDETKWTGPHCEIKVAVPTPEPIPETTPVAISSKPSYDKKSGFEVAMIVVLVFVLFSFVGFSLTRWCKERSMRRQSMDLTAFQLRERGNHGGYRDEPPTKKQVNLSPQRHSADVEAVALSMSSRDPFAAHLAPAPVPALNGAFGFRGEDDPQVYLGPPKDEDGHVLHSVEII